jgi:hypothetical protein
MCIIHKQSEQIALSLRHATTTPENILHLVEKIRNRRSFINFFRLDGWMDVHLLQGGTDTMRRASVFTCLRSSTTINSTIYISIYLSCCREEVATFYVHFLSNYYRYN